MLPRFDLIEVMRFDADEGIVALDRHIARLGASAAAFGFAFNRHDVRNELHAASFRLRDDATVRLLLSPTGRVAVETRARPDPPADPVTVRIVPLPVDPDDIRLRHKRTDRPFHEAARRRAGTAEVIFRRPDGQLTEGSYTNLFVERGDVLVTPPLDLGLMAGVLRGQLLEDGLAIEGEVREGDLAGGFLIGNAVRGLVAARLG